MGPAPTPMSRTGFARPGRQGLARQVDDELGLLARDEGAPVGLERISRKGVSPTRCCRGSRSPRRRDQLAVTRQFRLLHGTVEVHVEVHALHAQHVAEQELGVQAVALDALGLEIVGGLVEDVEEEGGEAVWSSE